MITFAFAGLILLFILNSRLSARVDALEEALRNKTAPVPTAHTIPTTPSPATTTPAVQQPNPIVTNNIVTSPDSLERFIRWAKTDWLLKLGALLILMGFGWLVTYAFLNDWIGPGGRVTLGLACGSLIMMFGWWRMQKFISQGGVFLVLGSSTVLLTIFASRAVYGDQFFSPITSLATALFTISFVSLASVLYRNKSLSFLSLVFAYGSPLLVHAPHTDIVLLFSYLLVVTLGGLWIVSITQWGELALTALIALTYYSAPHLIMWQRDPDRALLTLFAYAFTSLLFISNVSSFKRNAAVNTEANVLTAAGTGMFLLAWIVSGAPKELQSLILSAWTLVFIVGAFLIFKVTSRREPFYTYAGIGVALLAAATASELHGAALTIALTIECVVIALVMYVSTIDMKIASKFSLLLIVPVVLSSPSLFSSAWKTSVLNQDFFVLLIISISTLGLGYFLSKNPVNDPEVKSIKTLLYSTGSLFAYALLWLSLHAAIPDSDTATMASLIAYTCIGLSFYIYGNWASAQGMKLHGGILLGFVVGRLLLIDVWKMEIPGRIITFFMIGALLTTTAFMRKKKITPSVSQNI